ncbi:MULTISPECIES: preprotein translocase subunit YajC [unclassified Fibrobacter]|uniref:preprotein translocase subunit YajC n=1 Tax=unclassified Fibrobacter TaxID=2634177 RepID=UPI000D6CD4DB|nr:MULTISPECIES: preprotein translocase subunit YajC [unclassified Fibrobacter]PWJ69098.1 preprotein translocase YajC subunit [Fibrobacter sp. UWR4]PZW72929.1 preprotein translocase YajC subunit [Fibrobacter sp. UWR1]
MKIKIFLAALLTAAAFTFAEGEAAPAAAAPTLSAAPAAEGSLAAASQQAAPTATAEAATETAAPEQEQPSMLGGMMPIILLFVVMWLFFIRPKNKEMKQQEAMRKALKKGDKVMTAAGIIGVVTNIDETSTVITIRTGSTTLIDLEKAAVLRVINADAKAAEAKVEEKK